MTPEERFGRAYIIDDATGCWIWQKCRSNGYGVLRVAGKNHPAHRYSYTLSVGPIPEGLVLDHLCRNPPCVNPEHLEPVTRGENVLRGFSPAIVAWRTDVCKRGHEFTPENTYTRPTGYRMCRACRRLLRNAERVA